MKTYSLTVHCEDHINLRTALQNAADCVAQNPRQYEHMEVDDFIVLKGGPESTLSRIE